MVPIAEALARIRGTPSGGGGGGHATMAESPAVDAATNGAGNGAANGATSGAVRTGNGAVRAAAASPGAVRINGVAVGSGSGSVAPADLAAPLAITAPVNGSPLARPRPASSSNGAAVKPVNGASLSPATTTTSRSSLPIAQPPSLTRPLPPPRLTAPVKPTPQRQLPQPASLANAATVAAPGSSVLAPAASRLAPVAGGLQDLPSDAAFKWARDNYSKRQRAADIWAFVLSLRARLWLLDAKWTYPGGFSTEAQLKRRRALAAWVRETILQLGPTFIKLGQLTSTRSDLLPAEFVDELSKLQDRVPAFTPEKATALIEQELGAPVSELFSEFERQPIAAASLGQVHRAVLHNGEVVVVKVQRPGLRELFDIDLGQLKIIAEYFQNNEALGGPTRDWIGIYEECSKILYQEIDYINEGKNADRFRRDFRKVPLVKVPQVYWDYASQKVLTLEYLPGIKINNVGLLDAGGFSRPKLASYAIEAYLIQILRTGFFHADPHPGNLAVDSDGSLIYYDFGMMGEIKSFTKEKLLEMFYAVYERDAKKVITALVDLGALVPTGDVSSVRRSIQYFLDNLMNQTPEQAKTFAAIGEDLFSIAIDQPFRFPATFTFVLRAFSTLEGIGKTLDPDFAFAKIAAPYAQELLDVREASRGRGFFLEQVQKQAEEARDAAIAVPRRVRRMDEFLGQLESGDVKLRVRVQEAERAARRAGILQVVTINTIGACTLLNLGVTFSTQGLTAPATGCFVLAGIFSGLVFFGMKRVERLDKFEKMI
eukprot:SM000164S02263  [mRNA]  locus=s164:175492:181328:- [translate_table: standard]